MTWHANATVQDVSDGPSPITITATAESADIGSNTEGKIQSVEIKFVLGVDAVPLKVGDNLYIGGHFDIKV